jgi:uncharacterized protein
VTVLIDAGPLYALINRREHYHRWATKEAAHLEPPLHTCEAVLSETHFLLTRVHGGGIALIRMIEAGKIIVSFAYADHGERVHELMSDYANVPMSFADACLERMAEIHRAARIFTTDDDFRIYRKHRHEPLELLIP